MATTAAEIRVLDPENDGGPVRHNALRLLLDGAFGEHVSGVDRPRPDDELPQLLNVLNGEMNIVGPRPERPTIFAELREAIPDYHMRQRVRPGITGWAQVNQSYDTSVDDVRRKVEFDLEYVRRRGALK